MRKLKHLSLLTLLYLFAFSSLVYSQWQPDVRLTFNTALSYLHYNSSWRLAAEGPDVLHAVWQDFRTTYAQIFYKRSPNSGSTWGADVNLSNHTSGCGGPAIAVSGNVIHCVFEGGVSVFNTEIFYKRSTNSGLNWSANARLTIDSNASSWPSLAVSGSNIHAVWQDERDGNPEIYYKRSTDGGLTWGTDVRQTTNGFSSRYPSVSSQGAFVHIVWEDYNGEIAYKRSTNSGATWSADTALVTTPAISASPCVSFSGSTVHVTWTDGPDNPFEIFYKRSTNSGASWSANTRLTNNSAVKGYPNITAFGVNVHIAWNDNRDGNFEIYYKYSSDGGSTFSADTRLTNAPGDAGMVSTAIANAYVHIIWHDNRDGNWEIYYKRNPTGNNITGIKVLTTEARDFKLHQNYPNPFNPGTVINFQLSMFNYVKLSIHDVLGREVAVLVNEELKAGGYEVEWNASNYPSGVYLYKLQAEEFSDMKKMILIK